MTSLPENDKSKGKRHRKRGSKARKLTTKDIAIIGGFCLGLFIIFGIIAYFIMVIGGIIIPTNRTYIAPKQGITIYVQSNGFHTEFVVPIKNEEIKLDWLQKIGDSTLSVKYNNYKYISMGWGDEGFYMDSYNNEFPTIPTIFSALFVPTSTLMHIDFYANGLQTDASVVKLIISPQQYQILVKYIEQSFKKDIDNNFIPKNAKGYGKNDYFFHANNYYHLFCTCNDWTNNGLKSMGIKTASKAPFASGVLYHIK